MTKTKQELSELVTLLKQLLKSKIKHTDTLYNHAADAQNARSYWEREYVQLFCNLIDLVNRLDKKTPKDKDTIKEIVKMLYKSPKQSVKR